MKNFAKQLKLAAVLLIIILMVIGMTFAVSAEESDVSDYDFSDVTWVIKGTSKLPNRLIYTGRAVAYYVIGNITCGEYSERTVIFHKS